MQQRQVCQYWLEGKCRFDASKCRYFHPPNENRPQNGRRQRGGRRALKGTQESGMSDKQYAIRSMSSIVEATLAKKGLTPEQTLSLAAHGIHSISRLQANQEVQFTPWRNTQLPQFTQFPQIPTLNPTNFANLPPIHLPNFTTTFSQLTNPTNPIQSIHPPKQPTANIHPNRPPSVPPRAPSQSGQSRNIAQTRPPLQIHIPPQGFPKPVRALNPTGPTKPPLNPLLIPKRGKPSAPKAAKKSSNSMETTNLSPLLSNLSNSPPSPSPDVIIIGHTKLTPQMGRLEITNLLKKDENFEIFGEREQKRRKEEMEEKEKARKERERERRREKELFRFFRCTFLAKITGAPLCLIFFARNCKLKKSEQIAKEMNRHKSELLSNDSWLPELRRRFPCVDERSL